MARLKSTVHSFIRKANWFSSRRWRQLTSCYRPQDSGPVIQLQNEGVMMFSNPAAESGHSQQLQVSGPVWQKNILMGGKCQLPDFSGVIIYDGEGNVVKPNKPSRLALPWK